MRSAVWGNTDYRVTQPFIYMVHAGIDIGCPTGTTIYAARAGVVERVQQGMTSVRVGAQRDFYLHGTSYVRVGQAVAKGQAVIRSGMVAVDWRYPPTGPHLHFEIQNGYSLPAAPPGAWEAPINPVPLLSAVVPVPVPPPPIPIPVLEEEEMMFVGPLHKLTAPVTIKAFIAGSSYRVPINDSRLRVGAIAKDASIAFDGWRYSTSAVAASDLSLTPGSQPGPDYVWWHAVSGQWVPDAILATTGKVAGAPGPTIPVTEPMELFFAEREAAPVVVGDFATHDEVKEAIAGIKMPTSVTIDGPLTGKLS